jgi:hypothetical protein
MIELDKFHYGMKIPNSLVETVFGISKDDKNFHLKQFCFGQSLEEELDKNGMPCTVCIKDGELTILTHEEAAEYNPKRFRQQCNGLRRSHFRTLKVNSSELSSDETRKRLDRSVYEQSKILQAVESVRAEIILEPVERKSPPMLTSSSNKEKEVEASLIDETE